MKIRIKMVIIAATLLAFGLYVGSYAFLRKCYLDEKSFTYVIEEQKDMRLIVTVAKVFRPLAAFEGLLMGTQVELYRSRSDPSYGNANKRKIMNEPNHTPDGIRQPANGSPKPSV
jgi:hypothetical protein